MTHDDAKQLLQPLARDDQNRAPIDVSDWVMRDVRAIARSPGDDDALLCRVAALCAGMAAMVVVGVATVSLLQVEENPLVEFASGVSAFSSEAQ